MPLPTEPIGSIPRPLNLLEAVSAAAMATDPSLEPLYEEAIRDTIAQFEATGSPVITDGEQRSTTISGPTAYTGSRTPARTASKSLSRRATRGACRV